MDFALMRREVEQGQIALAQRIEAVIAFVDGQDDAVTLKGLQDEGDAIALFLSRQASVSDHNAAVLVSAKIRHRLGQVLAATVNHSGGRPAKHNQADCVIPAALGDTPAKRQNVSTRSQQLAQIPWEKIAAAIEAKTEAEQRASLGPIVKALTPAPPAPESAPPVTAEGERFRVETADALDWFASLPEDSLDLVFGSPPYEDARLYLEGGHNVGIARDTEQWVEWMVRVYQAALRCCKGLVAFVVAGRTTDYRWSASPALLMADLCRKGIHLRCPPLYHRVGIPGSGGPDWLRNDYEFIVCAARPGRLAWSDNVALGEAPKYQPGGDPSHRRPDGSRVNRDADLNGDGYATTEERGHAGPHRVRQRAGYGYSPPEKANPGNVIRCSVGGGNMGDALCHENEAPFPEALAEFFVRSFCPPGGVVADPFSGSGTTGKMALAFGRRFLGCDLRASQVELTRKRLSSVQQHLQES